jgi:flagellar hook-basal body complex protein FliE
MAAGLAPIQAAAAYRATQAQGAAAGGATGAADGGSFGATLQRAVEGAVDLGHSADAASTQALLGQGSVTDVVLAVSRAEMALQTAVALRDKVVSAYQDVMRMPI